MNPSKTLLLVAGLWCFATTVPIWGQDFCKTYAAKSTQVRCSDSSFLFTPYALRYKRAFYQAETLTFNHPDDSTLTVKGILRAAKDYERVDVDLTFRRKRTENPYFSSCVTSRGTKKWIFYENPKGQFIFEDNGAKNITPISEKNLQMGIGANLQDFDSLGATVGLLIAGDTAEFSIRLFDSIGCQSDSTPLPPTNPCNLQKGKILREIWYGIFEDKTPVTQQTTKPNESSFLPSFQNPINIADNYSTRVRGYLHPPISGIYTFNVLGDDYTDLYLSSNDQPENKKRICFAPYWTIKDQYDKFASQTSDTIRLDSNKRYYIELWHHESGDGDGFLVSWKTPLNQNAVTWSTITGNYLSPFCTNDTVIPLTQAPILELRVNPEPQQERIKIEWTTNLKANYFELQKLNKEGTFETIEKWENTKNEPYFYTFDPSPNEGQNIYQLRSKQKNGKEQHYQTTTQHKSVEKNNYLLVPNPANDFVTFQTVFAAPQDVFFYNAMGQQVAYYRLDSNNRRMDISSLRVGQYWLRISSKGKKDVIRRLYRQE